MLGLASYLLAGWFNSPLDPKYVFYGAGSGGKEPRGAYQSPGSAVTVCPATTVTSNKEWSVQLTLNPQGTADVYPPARSFSVFVGGLLGSYGYATI